MWGKYALEKNEYSKLRNLHAFKEISLCIT